MPLACGSPGASLCYWLGGSSVSYWFSHAVVCTASCIFRCMTTCGLAASRAFGFSIRVSRTFRVFYCCVMEVHACRSLVAWRFHDLGMCLSEEHHRSNSIACVASVTVLLVLQNAWLPGACRVLGTAARQQRYAMRCVTSDSRTLSVLFTHSYCFHTSSGMISVSWGYGSVRWSLSPDDTQVMAQETSTINNMRQVLQHK